MVNTVLSLSEKFLPNFIICFTSKTILTVCFKDRNTY